MINRRFRLMMNFTISARLRAAGLLALAGVLATGWSGYQGLTQSNDGLATSITATSAVLNQMQGDMMHDALRADVLYSIQTGPDGVATVKAGILADVDDHIAKFERAFAALEALPLDRDIRASVNETRPLVDTYLGKAKLTSDLAFRDQAAGKAGFADFMVTFSALEENLGALGSQIEAVGNQAGNAALDANGILIKVILAATIAAATVLAVSNLLIGRSITGPLRRVKTAIQEVVNGNLSGRYSAFDTVSDLDDEVGEIALSLENLREKLRAAVQMEGEIKRTQAEQQIVVTALSVGLQDLCSGNLTKQIDVPFAAAYEDLRGNYNQTVSRLNQTIAQLVQASRSIRARADDITQASTDLAQRTENQAATLEQTAAALDQLTGSVTSAANGAKEVETIVQRARQEAEENGKVVLGAVDAMNGIERSSDQISRIIGVIDDIAFQTNLLALNAGVEAARAGESGRGFAVVASEVRALAQRSSDASREIKDLISTSTQLVGRGVKAVGSAGHALTSLVERVSHIASLVSGIASGAAQQSVALAEVNIGVTQLDQVAQRNAAMVEQAMTATQSLQQETLGMDRLVSHFTTQSGTANRCSADRPQPQLRAVANR